MILNYRVEICRQCYFKRTKECKISDAYINNSSSVSTRPGGECPSRLLTPWLPRI